MIRIPKGAGWPILTPRNTPAFDHVADAYPMPSVALGQPPVSDGLYHGFEDVDVVPQELYEKYDVKRGLRNADGSGVLVGLTTISNVHGYNKTDHGIEPDDGRLIYRGMTSTSSSTGRRQKTAFATRRLPTCSSPGAFPRARNSMTSAPASTRASSCPRATWVSSRARRTATPS